MIEFYIFDFFCFHLKISHYRPDDKAVKLLVYSIPFIITESYIEINKNYSEKSPTFEISLSNQKGLNQVNVDKW